MTFLAFNFIGCLLDLSYCNLIQIKKFQVFSQPQLLLTAVEVVADRLNCRCLFLATIQFKKSRNNNTV